ncbi:energy-coupling factor transporter transmembrane component T [Shewanella sp. 10N.286.51.B7]|uniref:energy-coupling factor transporter transmembrane component T n=1 Tax=Shewanella sp. 10N.286.51.B7 TaxID=1880836 RepID=UPI001F539C4B|nr:energy-coupling factor transporter transmembrane component T [Shewanella sp. 10N.286.51.B7]
MSKRVCLKSDDSDVNNLDITMNKNLGKKSINTLSNVSTNTSPNASSYKARLTESKRKRWLCGVAIIFSIVLSSSAFLVTTEQLGYLAVINLGLMIHAWICKARLKPLVKLFAIQSVITVSLYALFYGSERVLEALIVVLRIILVMLPSWWLASTQTAHHMSQVLCLFLPSKWAFVITTSIKLLPFITQEVRDIYHIQCLRGARIMPKELINPINWIELVRCVLFPLLIQLLSLSKHIAKSAQQRHFDKHSKHTHWPLS